MDTQYQRFVSLLSACGVNFSAATRSIDMSLESGHGQIQIDTVSSHDLKVIIDFNEDDSFKAIGVSMQGQPLR